MHSYRCLRHAELMLTDCIGRLKACPTFRMTSSILIFCLMAGGGALGAQAAETPTPAPLPDIAVRVRAKDISRVQGVRQNHLYGVGVIVGLSGTGDGGELARNLLSNVLERTGITIEASKLTGENIAAVKVTAMLPAFAKEGGTIDVTVSSMDDAKSLRGGVLLPTPLYGLDREVYVLAHGPLSIGGFSFEGSSGSVSKGHSTVGRIPDGGLIEREVPCSLEKDGVLGLVLKEEDFTTATRLAKAVNEVFPNSATSLDAKLVQVKVPTEYSGSDQLVPFISRLRQIELVPDDAPARVVVSERTGTIVVGGRVRISRVGISHGNITVVISESKSVSQPTPFSQGSTELTDETSIDVEERKGYMHVLGPGVSVTDLASALNKLGVTPGDLCAILQGIKRQGALHAELVIM